jgi:hypothetical protein
VIHYTRGHSINIAIEWLSLGEHPGGNEGDMSSLGVMMIGQWIQELIRV